MNSDALLLLDTHVWIWWADQDRRLPQALKRMIRDHDGTVAVSAASVYETIILARRGRIELDRDVDDWIERASCGADIAILPLDAAIAHDAAHLPWHHGDPIDRLIIASAIHHDALLASVDSKFPAYEALGGRLISG